MNTHTLKTWPEFFEPILNGIKTAELRRDDRGFAVGDVLELVEYDPKSHEYSGRSVNVRVTHIVACSEFGLHPGFVMLSFASTRHEAMRAFVRDVADNWDCDADAHKYRTTCRSCAARALLDAEKNTPSASGTDGYLPDPCARCGKLDQLVEDLCHACRT